MAEENVFVLDTSALLALRGDEAGAGRVETLLSRASDNTCRLLISFMSRMEVLYLIWREEGKSPAREAFGLSIPSRLSGFPVKLKFLRSRKRFFVNS